MIRYDVTLSCGYPLTVSVNPPAVPPAPGQTLWCPRCGTVDMVMTVTPAA